MRTRVLAIAIRATIAIFLVLGVARLSFAQITGAGAIHGQVTDPSAAAVAGASIIVTTPDGKSLAATTSRDGVFELKGLAPGKYTVEVIAKGFALYKNETVQVTASQVQQLNVSLTSMKSRSMASRALRTMNMLACSAFGIGCPRRTSFSV